MRTHTYIRDAIPAALAFIASAAITAASATINARYGWAKGGGDPLASIIWSTVAVAASVGTALSLPACMLALRRWRPFAASIALLCLVLCGGYSITAALGSAAGGRSQAANSEADKARARDRARDSYDRARGELEKIGPARPLDQLDAERRRLLATPGLDCERRARRTSRTVCDQVDQLDGEAGRSRRRAELEATMAKASAALDRIGPVHAGNSDAAALAAYAKAAGVGVTADKMNMLLALWTVALVELAGGLLAAVGATLLDHGPRAVREPAARLAGTAHEPQPDHGPGPTPNAGREPPQGRARTMQESRPSPRGAALDRTRERIMAALDHAGGELLANERALARRLSASRSTTRRALLALSACGAVAITAGRGGTASGANSDLTGRWIGDGLFELPGGGAGRDPGRSLEWAFPKKWGQISERVRPSKAREASPRGVGAPHARWRRLWITLGRTFRHDAGGGRPAG